MVRVARLGLAALGATLALAATSQPSGAQPAAAPAADAAAAAKIAKGRELFANFGCGSCHSLSDAGATGHVGPSLDGDANLTEGFIVSRVANGQAGMPAFADQLSPEEIADLAAYVAHVAAR